MDFQEFKQKYRCSISRKLECSTRYHMRSVERKTYHLYIDVRTMLPFDPNTALDCRNCITFSSDISSEDAKKKAFDFIKPSKSLEPLL